MTDAPVIAIIGDSFRPGVIDGAAAYCRRNALTLDPRWACRAPLLLAPPSADGLLSQLAQELPLPSWLADSRTPTVHLNPRPGAIWVSTDYGACTRLALQEFADQGIRSACLLQAASTVMDPASGDDPSATAVGLDLRCLPIRLSRPGGDLRSAAR